MGRRAKRKELEAEKQYAKRETGLFMADGFSFSSEKARYFYAMDKPHLSHLWNL